MVVARAEPAAYGRVARTLHWVTAALLLVTIPAGLAMIRVAPGSTQDVLFLLHKNIGAILIVVVALRIVWRLTHPPAPLTGIPRWQVVASAAVHGSIYLLLVFMVISGYLRTVAGGFPIELLNALGIPPLFDKSKPLEDAALAAHTTLIWPLLALIAAHVAAALHHRFVRRDHVLGRMWPAGGRPTRAG
jgi:cytochrome b561